MADLWKALLTAVVTLIVMEYYQATPWLANKLMYWAAHVRYPNSDQSSRRKQRAEEWVALLSDLPMLLRLPTAAWFLLAAVVHRVTRRRHRSQRTPQVVRRSLGARFRIALSVMIVIGAVVGIETGAAAWLAGADNVLGGGLVFGLAAGLLAAIEVAIPPRVPAGLASGITVCLALPLLGTFGGEEIGSGLAVGLGGGIAFGLATALVLRRAVSSRPVGVPLAVLFNLSAMGMAVFMIRQGMEPRSTILDVVLIYVVIGIAAGCLTGLAVKFAATRGHNHLCYNLPATDPSIMLP